MTTIIRATKVWSSSGARGDELLQGKVGWGIGTPAPGPPPSFYVEWLNCEVSVGVSGGDTFEMLEDDGNLPDEYYAALTRHRLLKGV